VLEGWAGPGAGVSVAGGEATWVACARGGSGSVLVAGAEFAGTQPAKRITAIKKNNGMSAILKYLLSIF